MEAVLVTAEPANEMLICFSETKTTGHGVEACAEERTLTSSCTWKESLPSPSLPPPPPKKNHMELKDQDTPRTCSPEPLSGEEEEDDFLNISSSFENCPREHWKPAQCPGVHVLDLEACAHTWHFLFLHVYTNIHTEGPSPTPFFHCLQW